MLRGNDNRIDVDRFAILIGNRYLRLTIRTEIRQFTALSDFRQTAGQAMRQCNRQRHVLRRLIRCIAEHHALIPCTDGIFLFHLTILCFQGLINSQGNIR